MCGCVHVWMFRLETLSNIVMYKNIICIMLIVYIIFCRLRIFDFNFALRNVANYSPIFCRMCIYCRSTHFTHVTHIQQTKNSLQINVIIIHATQSWQY